MSKTNPACVAFGTFLVSKFAEVGIPIPDKSTGTAMATRMWDAALRKVKHEEFVEEGFSSVTLKILSKQIILQGGPLSGAERYLTVAVYHASLDAQRRQQIHDRCLDTFASEVADTAFVQSLEDSLSPSDLNRLLVELAGIHPRAVEWVEAMLEDVPKKVLAEQWGVTPAAITNFENRYLGEIRAMTETFLLKAV